MIRIRIFHNLDRTPAPGDPDEVTEVYAYTEMRMDDDAALTRAAMLFTYAHKPELTFGDPDPHALAYRARGNRAIGVNDVIAVNDRYYRGAFRGWVPVETLPAFADRSDRFSTWIKAELPAAELVG